MPPVIGLLRCVIFFLKDIIQSAKKLPLFIWYFFYARYVRRFPRVHVPIFIYSPTVLGRREEERDIIKGEPLGSILDDL